MPAKSQIEALLQQIRNLLEAQESESPVLTGEVLALVEEVTDILLDLEPTDEVLAWLRTLRGDVQINKWVVTSDTEAALQAKLSEALEEARSFVVEDIDLSWDEVSDKPSTFPPTSHTHTASQIDDLEQVIADLIEALELGEVTWSIIQNKPATFPPDAHTHPTSEVDGFEAEVQALIEGSSLASVEWDNVTGKPTAFPPVSHTHAWSQITERPTEFPPASHSHVTGDITGLGDFVDAAVEAADIQWDNIIGKPTEFPPVSHTHPWGEITGKPNTFPPSPHDHDDLYYRKAHIDNTFVPRARTLTMEGAENQIAITPEGAQSLNNNRTWSFTLPQDIHTEANPTFNRPFFSDGMQHAGNILPDAPLESSLGSAARRYLSAHVADLCVTNLVTENLRSTIWGGLLTGLGNEVAAPATSGATTMQFRHNNFSDGHVVLLQRPGEIEYIRINSEASGDGPYTYNVIRNLQGTGGKSWSEGDGAFSEGVAGTGWIEQYAINAVTTGASITGPGMVFMRRTGSGLSSKDYRAAVGYLEGYYGQGSDTWGIGAGVRSGRHFLSTESGIFLRDNNTDLLRADENGLFVDATGTFSGTLSFQNGEITGNITMGGSSQKAPASVTLSADPAETPDEVRFYQDNVLISTQTAAPFEHSVSEIPAGSYQFRAEAQTGQDILNSGIRTLNVEEAWNRSRLTARSRGDVTGTLTLLPENIRLEATGTDSGLRPKDAPQQYEATDKCRLGERWDFSFDGFSGQYGAWGRAGIQIESDHVDGHEVVLLDYLPLQRRMRLSVAKSDEKSVRQRTSKINLDTSLTGYVKIEDIQQRAHFQFYLDTTGDGEYDVIRSAHMDTLFDACEISLIATSRSSGQQIEALFTLDKVE